MFEYNIEHICEPKLSVQKQTQLFLYADLANYIPNHCVTLFVNQLSLSGLDSTTLDMYVAQTFEALHSPVAIEL